MFLCLVFHLIKRSVATKKMLSHYSKTALFAARPCFVYFEFRDSLFQNNFPIQWGCRWYVLSEWVSERQVLQLFDMKH